MAQNNQPNDFVKMQEQAIKRVREMQQKASPVPQNKPKETTEEKKESQILQPPPKKEEEKPKNESEKFEPKTVSKEKESNHGLFSNLLNLDTDMSIILPLLLFLGKDGADDILILALLYIMS